MIREEQISPHGRRLLDRRHFLGQTAGALGGLGLANLLATDSEDPANFSGKAPIRPDIDANNPYAPRGGHFVGAAKQPHGRGECLHHGWSRSVRRQ